MPMNGHYRIGDTPGHPTGSNPTPDAYAYAAALHCPDCARKAWGVGQGGHIAVDAQGDPCMTAEGGPVGAIMPWDWDRDEREGSSSPSCATTG